MMMFKLALFIQLFFRNFGKTFTSIARIFLLSNFSVKLQESLEKDVVILANGPSLNKMLEREREFLQKKDLVCVNHFPSTAYFEELKPRYLISSAQDLWRDDIEEHFMIQSEKLFKTLVEKTNWELIFYFPFEARRYTKWQNCQYTGQTADIV